MKAFLEEYGIAIFTLVCIALLIAIATPVGDAIKTALVGIVEDFVDAPSVFEYTTAAG